MKKRAGAILIMILSLLILDAPPSHAARCEGNQYHPFDIRRVLLQADGAFVGSYLSFGEHIPGETSATWRFRVDQAVKGQIPRYIEVDLGEQAFVNPGERVGLIVYKTDHPWWDSGLGCKVGPEALLRAAEPLPVPDGTPPPLFILGGSFGEARLLVLDKEGRTLAYGAGKGAASFAICPGQRRVVELVSERNGLASKQSLAVRDLSSLRVLREIPLPRFDRTSDEESKEGIAGISCRDQTGERLFLWIATSSLGDADSWESRIAVFRNGRIRNLITGQRLGDVHFMPSEPVAFAISSASHGRVYRLDLEKGGVETIAKSPVLGFFSLLAVNPSGSRVAWVIGGEYQNKDDRLVLFDLSKSPVATKHVPVSPRHSGGLYWIDDSTLTIGTPDDQSLGSSQVHTYDQSLRLKGKFGGWFNWSGQVAVGGTIYAIGGKSPIFQKAQLPTGPTVPIRSLDWVGPGPLLAFPPGARFAPESMDSAKISGEVIEVPVPSPSPSLTLEPLASLPPSLGAPTGGRALTELVGLISLVILAALFVVAISRSRSSGSR